MNENLNLLEILKDCPKGTKLYSTWLGTVEFVEIFKKFKQIVVTRGNSGHYWCFNPDGRYAGEIYYDTLDGEITLFPSRDQRDWSKFQMPEQHKDGDIFVLNRKDVSFYWIFSRKKQENSKQIIAYHAIYFDGKTDKDLEYYPEGPITLRSCKPGELRKATFAEQMRFKNALVARGCFTVDGKTLQKLKFKVGNKVCRKGSSDILTIERIANQMYIFNEGKLINQGFPLEEQHLYELAPCETQQYDITTIEPGKVYWFQVTDDIKKNEILLQDLLLKSQDKIQEGKRNKYNPGDLIYLQGNKMKICEYAKGSYYAIRMFGTEIKLTPKK